MAGENDLEVGWRSRPNSQSAPFAADRGNCQSGKIRRKGRGKKKKHMEVSRKKGRVGKGTVEVIRNEGYPWRPECQS